MLLARALLTRARYMQVPVDFVPTTNIFYVASTFRLFDQNTTHAAAA
jgi:hypothetical protein